jgi:hypothetical protein
MPARTVSLLLGSLALFIAAGGQAHHSFESQYDAKQPITLTGTVTKIAWMNPHVYFYIDAKNADGKVENWALEMGPPHLLEKRGWKRNSMQIGDVVRVNAFRARDGSHTASARRVALAKTGQVLGAASSYSHTITSGASAAKKN